jgi:hypothetical protein
LVDRVGDEPDAIGVRVDESPNHVDGIVAAVVVDKVQAVDERFELTEA